MRSLQLRYEPQARLASAIIEKLAAFDRDVEESLGPEGTSVEAQRSAQADLEVAAAELNARARCLVCADRPGTS